MPDKIKLGVFQRSTDMPDFYDDVPYAYPDIWQLESTTGPDRLVIGPSGRHIDLMLNLAAQWGTDCGLLYILLISRSGNRPGRYQSPQPVNLETVTEFCERFEDYLESDSRHHFWIASAAGAGNLVYDRHNLIFAYGDIDLYIEILEARGFRQAEVIIPVPHSHHYNAGNDAVEDELIRFWEWRYFPLQDGDDSD
jgi:hypothetical protein